MRKVMIAAMIAALPLSALAADDELVGTYKLISSTTESARHWRGSGYLGKEPERIHHLRQGRAHARAHC
jgi:hypothetical protein